jgi:pimeloyl-ACP methyl ester carboxylesterase
MGLKGWDLYWDSKEVMKMDTQPLQRASVNGTTLAYSIYGLGEPVVCIHGSILADAFLPLVAQPALVDRYQLIIYHRRGYGSSARATGPATLVDHAADCCALLDALGIKRAHVMGHSYGATTALQVALAAPSVAHSLVLLEPALFAVPSAAQFAQQVAQPAGRAYEAGDIAQAVDTFLRGVGGEHYRAAIERALPAGAWERALDAFDAFYHVDALGGWQFTRDEAARLTQPALAVLGAESGSVLAMFPEVQRLLLEWLPNAEGYVLPHATHLLQLMNPQDLATAAAAFWSRHAIAVSGQSPHVEPAPAPARSRSRWHLFGRRR